MSASATETPWTIGRLLKWTEDYFRAKGIDPPRIEAQILLAHVVGCSRPDLYVRFLEEPSAAQRTSLRELIKRRMGGTPVAYLTSEKEFFLLSFEVTQDTLIPRPESETLVATAISKIENLSEPRLLDIGCGCGNMAISIAHRLKNARVVATDISAVTLQVARRNAARHGVEDRVDLRAGDLFAPLKTGEQFDCIIANLPYVRTDDLATLEPQARDHEPRLAFDGGSEGFDLINRLIAGAMDWLRPGGWLMFEHDMGQDFAARTKVEAAGLIPEKPILDMWGIPRVVAGRKPE